MSGKLNKTKIKARQKYSCLT